MCDKKAQITERHVLGMRSKNQGFESGFMSTESSTFMDVKLI